MLEIKVNPKGLVRNAKRLERKSSYLFKLLGEDAEGNGFTTQRRRDEFSQSESPALQLRGSGGLTTLQF